MFERRAAAADDEPFLRALHATTRPDVVAWEDNARKEFLELQFRAQQREWAARFPNSVHELILVDGQPVGRLWLAWLADECVVVDMTLVPEQRRGGIGTRVMREILAEADVRNLPVRVTVERTNAASLAFCGRLGFDTIAEDAVYVVLLRPVSPDLPRRASA